MQEWINYRQKQLQLSKTDLSEKLGQPEFIINFFEDGTLKRIIAHKIIEDLISLYSIDKNWFNKYFAEKYSIPKNGEPYSFKYLRNLQKAPYRGEDFGQHIEPHGEYMSFLEGDDIGHLSNFEFGEITFNNPLVLDWSSTDFPMDATNKSWGWKSQLFSKYNKKGQELSNYLIIIGYDGIITLNGFGEGSISEIVNLMGIKK